MGFKDYFEDFQQYENDGIRLRFIEDQDKETFVSMMGNLQESVIKVLWEKSISSDDSITFAADYINSGMMIGNGSVNNRKSGYLELGYEVKNDFRRKGYGTKILDGLIQIVSHIESSDKIIARIRADNLTSIHIAEKLGGKKIYEEPSYYEELVERDGDQFWGKYSDMLDHVRMFVYEFDRR